MKLLKTDVHTLEEVKLTLDDDETMSFVPLLEKHHDFLEESIAVIMSKDAMPNEKQLHLARFLHLVAMHAKAEEETLYIGLRTADEKLARIEGTQAQDEHDIAMQLSDELKEMGFETSWSEEIEAKAQVVAGLVKNHIAEEESEIFKTAKKDIPFEQMDSFRDEYIEKCRLYLEEEIGIWAQPMDLHRPNATF